MNKPDLPVSETRQKIGMGCGLFLAVLAIFSIFANKATDNKIPANLPKYEITENQSMAPKNGRSIHLEVSDPNITKEQCIALNNKYKSMAGPEGQVAVHKPLPQLEGAVVPWCVNNMDGKGIFFNPW